MVLQQLSTISFSKFVLIGSDNFFVHEVQVLQFQFNQHDWFYNSDHQRRKFNIFGIQHSLVYEICLVWVSNISFSLYVFLHCFLIKFTRYPKSVTMLHLWSLMAPIQQFHVAIGHSFRYQISYLWFHNLHLLVFNFAFSLFSPNTHCFFILYHKFNVFVFQFPFFANQHKHFFVHYFYIRRFVFSFFHVLFEIRRLQTSDLKSDV